MADDTTVLVRKRDADRLERIKRTKDLGSKGRVIGMLLDEFESRHARA